MLETIQEIIWYDIIRKKLMPKKWLVDCKTIEVTLYFFIIITSFMVEKKEDLGAFIIHCTIGTHKFEKALYELCENINLIWYAIYQWLFLGTSTPTTMTLLMTNCSIKKMVVVLYDVLVKFNHFIFPMNFVSLIVKSTMIYLLFIGNSF